MPENEASAVDPSAPTEIIAETPPVIIQRIEINSAGSIKHIGADVLLLAGMIEDQAGAIGDAVKAELLTQRVKYANGLFARAELKLQAIPRELSTRKVLRAIAAKAKQQEKDLLEVLLGMEGAISFGKEALGKFLGKNDIDKMCEDGTPRAPSLVVEATGTGGAPNVATALDKLCAIAMQQPALFKPPGQKPAKKRGEKSPLYAFTS